MQVALVCNSAFGTDGISMFVLNNHKYFRHEGTRYHLIYSSIHSSENVVEGYVADFKKEGDNAVFIPKENGMVNYAINLFKFFRKEKIDVLHVHGSSSAILLEMVVAKIANIKKIVTHSHNTRGSHNLIHRIIRPAVNWLADEKLACGDLAGKWMYGKRGKFIIIPNCIDIEKYKFEKNVRNEIRKKLGIDKDTFVIGHVGMFTEIKNQIFLIRIMNKFKHSGNDNFRLLLIGHGALKKQVEQEVKNLRLSENVMFLGNRNDVPLLLMAMDIFCLPSLYEGFPIVSVEAQASGLPTLLSQNISPEVCITDLVELLPIDKGVEQWRKKILRNIESKTDRSMYSQKIKVAGYDIHHSASLLESIYSI